MDIIEFTQFKLDLKWLIDKEIELLEIKSQEWYNDDEEDKSISLMCDNQIKELQSLKNKVSQLKMNQL